MTMFSFDAHGWLSGVNHIPSPNFDARPDRSEITLLVIHNISLPPGIFTGNAIVEFFTNTLDTSADPYFATIKGMCVSAHFVVRRDGETIQFVACNDRAWHAGQSQWYGRGACNDYSIGIELEGTDKLPFTDAQYATLTLLTDAIRQRYPIKHIVGHSDIAPGRKTDPGASFDWSRYRATLS